ncbi:hypothetical protein BW14_06005 [Bifidobacterium sp. UTBIF-68]|uniref:hypothetical protein n=1 Tax=Bifidobacterium sp. UTBIF-68 TaxID=1465262 RepID=UPI00112E31B8|nr:hypothetical protein [Bifidobacterium sp. UTBIF-68]TPF93227.1 hypothetical protein BW14_06005 [Bifidobacterium sp. UTBIF-68]
MDCMWAKPFIENSDGSWDVDDWTDGMPDNMAEEMKSAYLTMLDTRLHRLDPMLGELDFGDRVMPARFDKDGYPVERYDALAGRLTVDGTGLPVVEYKGESYWSPHLLAQAWHRLLQPGRRHDRNGGRAAGGRVEAE